MKIVNCKLSRLAGSASGGKIPARMRAGQAMMLTIIAIGGTLLAATTVSGLLVVYQLRQSSDAVNSMKAIFATDAGIEWGLYQFFNPDGSATAPQFSNGASVTVSCTGGADCKDPLTEKVQAIGTSGNAARALEFSL